jgi:hypothetical protein
MKAKLKEVKGELRRRMHRLIPEQGKWLKQIITGFFAYHAVPTNFSSSAEDPRPPQRPLAANATPTQSEGSNELGADYKDR